MKRTLIVVSLTFVAIFALVISGCMSPPEITAAKVYENQENWDGVIEQAKIAVEKYPTNPEAFYILGKGYAAKKMFREMNGAFNKSLAIGPKHEVEIKNEKNRQWAILVNQGVALNKESKFTEASEKFKLATEICPEKAMGFKNLGIAFSNSNQNLKGIEAFKSAIELDSEDAEAHYFLGMLNYNGKQYDEAISSLAQVIEKADPTTTFYVNAIVNSAYAYDLKGNTEKAIELYGKAINTTDDATDLKYNLARLYLNKKEFAKALEYFKDVISENPDDFQYNIGIGHTYSGLEQYKDAVPYFKKATEIEPDNYNAWIYLFSAYHNSGDTENAVKAQKRAEELDK